MLPVWNVEELEPAAETLSSAVAVKGALDTLRDKPLVGEHRNISNILPIALSGLAPLGIDTELRSLFGVLELHGCKRTARVPLQGTRWIPVFIQLHITRRNVILFTEARSIDSPWSGTSFRSVEFGSSSHHVCEAIPFVGVDVVALRVFDFLDVYVWSKTKDVGIIA